jgi:iron complex transport system substrate-binding protein
MGARRARRRAAAAVVAALTATMIAGCSLGVQTPVRAAAGTAQEAGFPLTLTDDASRTVTIGSPARRVVSLAPANTEIVYALGAFDRLQGVTTYDDYPADVKNVAKVGDFTTPNLEAIAAAKPDLILVTGGVQADVIEKLSGLGAVVMVVDPTDVDGVYEGILLVAKALGVAAKGIEVTDSMKAELASITERIGSAEPVPCFVEIGWNPLFTAGPGTLLDDLVTRAGGSNVVKEPGYVGYSVEQLVKDQPRVYLGTRSSLADAGSVGQRPGYGALGSVGGGRVVALDDNLVSRPGPRIVQGVAEIARALHPDRF